MTKEEAYKGGKKQGKNNKGRSMIDKASVREVLTKGMDEGPGG